MRNSGIVLMVVLISLTGALAGCTKSNPPTPTSTTQTTTSSPPATSSSPPTTTTPASTTTPTNPTPPTPQAPVSAALSVSAAAGPGCPQGQTTCTPGTAKFTITPGGWKTLHFNGTISGDFYQAAHLTIVDSAKAKAYDKELPAAPTPDPTSQSVTVTQKFQFDLTSSAPGEFTATLTPEDPIVGPDGFTVKGTVTATY